MIFVELISTSQSSRLRAAVGLRSGWSRSALRAAAWASTKRVISMANQMKDGTFPWEDNPISIVENDGDQYVVDGHHRLQAAKYAGLSEVPVQDVTAQLSESGYLGYPNMDDVLNSAADFTRNNLNQYKLRKAF